MAEDPQELDSFLKWTAWWRQHFQCLAQEEKDKLAGHGRQLGKEWMESVVQLVRGSLDDITCEELDKGLRAWVEAVLEQDLDSLDRLLSEPIHDELPWNNKEFLLVLASNCCTALGRASPAMKDDREVVLAAVQYDGYALREASERLRADKEIVLIAAGQTRHNLEYAPEFCASKECMLEAVRQDGLALDFASPELQGDRDVVLAAVQQSGFALSITTPELQADLEVVLEAVRTYGQVLEYASAELKSNKEVVLEAVRSQTVHALRHASDELRADKDFMVLASRCTPEGFGGVDWLEVSSSRFEMACKSSIAVAGESAPFLSVTLSLLRPIALENVDGSDERQPTPDKNLGDDEKDKNREQTQERNKDEQEQSFHCEACLMSGASFNFDLPDSPSIGPLGERRPGAILDDFAKALVDQVAKRREFADVQRVFISFTTGDGSEATVVSPWDWDRPLIEFLP